MEGRIIKVNSLSPHVTTADLEMKFSISGEVEDCIIIQHDSQVTGFVCFVDEEGVDSAQVFNGTEFMNATLQIEIPSVDEYLSAKESLLKVEQQENPIYDVLTSEPNEDNVVRQLTETRDEEVIEKKQVIERQQDLSETVIIQHKEDNYPDLQEETKNISRQQSQIADKIKEIEKQTGIEMAVSSRVPIDSKDPFNQLISLNYIMVTGVLYFAVNIITLVVG